MIFHLKESVQLDLPARAVPVTDEVKRRPVLEKVVARWGRSDRLEAFVAHSPLIGVRFDPS
jgi:hypothetical protein